MAKWHVREREQAVVSEVEMRLHHVGVGLAPLLRAR